MEMHAFCFPNKLFTKISIGNIFHMHRVSRAFFPGFQIQFLLFFDDLIGPFVIHGSLGRDFFETHFVTTGACLLSTAVIASRRYCVQSSSGISLLNEKLIVLSSCTIALKDSLGNFLYWIFLLPCLV